ncbi:hypothetical protein EON64_00955 [archaeon]|nr:MAG: hypothetical protein EON64_00955 [archaeon]
MTSESLSVEILISLAERPAANARQRQQWSWGSLGRRLLDIVGYKRESVLAEGSLKLPLIFLHGYFHSAAARQRTSCPSSPREVS